jgi:hypothetical protein
MFPLRFSRRSRLPAAAVAVGILLSLSAPAGQAWAATSPGTTTADTTTAATTTAAPPADVSTPAAPPPAPVLTWRAAHPATSPPPLQYPAAAYDADNRTVVLFGGRVASGKLSDDTWVWNGTNWNDFPNSQPPAREMASMAFDPTLHQLILFGGQGDQGTLLNDTWAWNGTQWVQLDGAGPAPTPREASAFAYDPAGRLVLFGGTGYAAGASTPDTTGNTSTTTATLQAETTLGDTWQWTGAGWIQSTSLGPPARSGAEMSYDSAVGATVLFSGETSAAGAGTPSLASDTWTWDGLAWNQETATTAPPPRYGGLFVDVPSVDGALLVGGAGQTGALADGWRWSKQGWQQAQNAGNPTPRQGAAGGFDIASSTLVLFGGIGPGASALGDTEVIGPALPPTVSPSTQPQSSPSTTSTIPTAATRPAPTSPPTTPSPTTTTIALRTVPTTSPSAAVLPRTMTLLANVHSVHQGATVQLSGTGFQAGSLITITFHSEPALIGHTVADRNGSFTDTVDVPRSASPGQHHFVAQGLDPSGGTAELVAAVYVLAPASHKPTALQTGVMIALALIIPGGAWMAMSGSTWWRRRRGRPLPDRPLPNRAATE